GRCEAAGTRPESKILGLAKLSPWILPEGDQHRPGPAKRSRLPRAGIESAASKNFSPLNPLFSLHFAIFLQNFPPYFIPALATALIMPAIALAGTGSGPGIREGGG